MQIVVKKREEQLRIIFINHAVKDYNLKCIVPLLHGRLRRELVETVKDFLTELDMKPGMHLVEITIFSLNNVTVKFTKIMNNLLEHLKILIFKSHCSVLKISRMFPKKFCEKYFIRRPTCINDFFEIFETLIFKVLYFLKMCPIFVGSFHNFCRSVGR